MMTQLKCFAWLGKCNVFTIKLVIELDKILVHDLIIKLIVEP